MPGVGEAASQTGRTQGTVAAGHDVKMVRHETAKVAGGGAVAKVAADLATHGDVGEVAGAVARCCVDAGEAAVKYPVGAKSEVADFAVGEAAACCGAGGGVSGTEAANECAHLGRCAVGG